MAIRELDIFWHIALISIYIFNTIVAIVMSILTVRLLLKREISSTNSDARTRSSTKIVLIMNLANITFFFILFISLIIFGMSVRSKLYTRIGSGYAKLLVRKNGAYFIFILFCLFPDMLTVFNPIIYFSFNKAARVRVLASVADIVS